MAVSKLWAVTSRLDHVINYATNPEKTKRRKTDYSDIDYQALKDVLAYAKDEEKTEREFFCEGINCQAFNARDSFISVKEQFGKTDGIQAYHGYLSFKEQNISPELAQKIGMEFAKEVWGKRFQVVVTTHLNTRHLHCHFVLNSISFVDGKRCQDTTWFKFRKVADRICEKYGLYYDPNPNRSKVSSYYNRIEKQGVPTRYSMLRAAIDEALAHSTNIKSFEYALTKMGYKHCLKKFVSEAKRYGVLYCVLRDRGKKGDNTPVDIIARAEDASKIQRIFDKFELAGVDSKATVIADTQKDVDEREEVEKDKPTKSKEDLIADEALKKPQQRDGNAQVNPTAAKTEKSPPSEQSLKPEDTELKKEGAAKKQSERPSVREKLNGFIAQSKQQQEPEHHEPKHLADKSKQPAQTKHQQPKRRKARYSSFYKAKHSQAPQHYKKSHSKER